MPVTIQDDMWEAAQQLPSGQGKAYLIALIEYGMTSKEPKRSTAWLPLFTVTKDRIDCSARARKKAQKMAQARWSQDAEADSTSMIHKHDAQASNDSDAQASSTSSVLSRVEKSRERKNKKEGSSKDFSEYAVEPKVVKL